MSKQDRIHPRTPADVDRRFNGKISNVSRTVGAVQNQVTNTQKEVTNTQKEVTKTQKQVVETKENLESNIKAELDLKLGKDDNNQVVSMLNASADKINIQGDRLTIKSTNFELTEDGTVKTKAGEIGGWHLGLYAIPTSANSEDDVTDEESLRSPDLTGTKLDKDGVERQITYQAYLTAKGVYICGRYNTSAVSGDTYFNHTTWLELLEGLQRIENLEKRLNVVENQVNGGK